MNREKIILKTEKPVQENFLGANAVYHCYATLPDSTGRAYTEDECALEFERVKKCGLKIARTFFRWYGWDKEKQCFDWENEPYINGFYKWAKAMQDIGTDIALQIGWWSPADVMGGGANKSSPFNKDNNWENSVQNYAEWASEVAHQLIEVRGFTNIKYFMLFTEPQRQLSKFDFLGKTSYELWRDCAVAVHKQLLKDNRRHLVKLVGPNEGSTDTSVMVKWAAENCDDIIDIYSSHNYMPYKPVQPANIHSGHFATSLLPSIHNRGQCKVELKPNTEYEISVWLKKYSTAVGDFTGYFLVGLFDLEPGFEFFHAGTAPDTRLNPDSANEIDVSLITDEWQQFSVRVYNKTATEGYFGYLNQANELTAKIAIDDFSLKAVGSDVELLPDGGFENSIPYWKFVGGKHKEVVEINDTYYNWLEWINNGMKYLPEGKPYWFDEYNWTLSSVNKTKDAKTEDTDSLLQDKTRGVEFAVANNAFLNAGVQSSLLWTLFDQQWPDNKTQNINNFYLGDHRWGTMPVLKRTKVPYPAFYAFSLLSRYLGGGEGTKVYSGEGSAQLHSSAVVSPEGEITVLVTNKRRDYANFEINLSVFGAKAYNRHIYNPLDIFPNPNADIIPTDKILKPQNGILSDNLPPVSFAIYTTKNN